MANTRDTLGDQATLDGLVNHTLETFEDDEVTSLRNYAFYHNSGLKRVKLPNLTTAPPYSFGCSGLTKIEETDIPNVEEVNSYAFNDCKSLIEITLPKCKQFLNYASRYCTKLQKIYLKSSGRIIFGNTSNCFELNYALRHLVLDSPQKSTFISLDKLSPLARGEGAVYVPSTMLATYKADTNWSKLLIEDIANYPLEKFETITDTWAEIVTNQNYATDYAIGDTKAIKIGSLWYTAEIVGIDKDVDANGDTIPLTWVLIDCLADTHRMNATHTNANGWVQTEMRSYLINDILPNIDIKDLIVPAVKTFYDVTTKSTLSCTDSVWIPSMREMGSDTHENSGCVYDGKFATSSDRAKYKRESKRVQYWSRSADETAIQGFECIGTGGSLSLYTLAKSPYGVLLGFCTM